MIEKKETKEKNKCLHCNCSRGMLFQGITTINGEKEMIFSCVGCKKENCPKEKFSSFFPK